eukprot:scpid38401/ scgid18745/ 
MTTSNGKAKTMPFISMGNEAVFDVLLQSYMYLLLLTPLETRSEPMTRSTILPLSIRLPSGYQRFSAERFSLGRSMDESTVFPVSFRFLHTCAPCPCHTHACPHIVLHVQRLEQVKWCFVLLCSAL